MNLNTHKNPFYKSIMYLSHQYKIVFILHMFIIYSAAFLANYPSTARSSSSLFSHLMCQPLDMVAAYSSSSYP